MPLCMQWQQATAQNERRENPNLSWLQLLPATKMTYGKLQQNEKKCLYLYKFPYQRGWEYEFRIVFFSP